MYQLRRRCVGVYNKESSKLKHRLASIVATMARRMIQLCFLVLVVNFVDGQCQSNCGCIYCSQSCGCGQDDQLLKNSVVALQSQAQLMMTEIEKLRQQAASTNECKDCSISCVV